MRANQIDNRGRWIIIGGTMGATIGAGVHELPIGVALGVAVGMIIGHYMNLLTLNRR
ncbi:MAG: hypothetical protein ABI311_10000 [Gemmatimonadaceae bacterium]